MPFSWFVAFRYLREAKGQTLLILAAVSVGVSVVIFLSALINGLQVSLLDKTLGSQAHVTLHLPREAPRALVHETEQLAVARIFQPAPQRLRSIDRWPSIVTEAERLEGVVAVSPSLTGAGFAVRSLASEPVVVRGVDPERFLSIVDIRQKLIAGRYELSGGYVVVGSTLAQNLNVAIGDKIRLNANSGGEDVVTVAGIMTLGNEAVDRTWVLTSLTHAQSLYALPGGITAIELKVADVFDAERVAVRLSDATGLEADSWMALNTALLTGLSAQSSSKSLIQFFVVVAVALGIASVLAVSVVQKSREIGILRAVGTSPRRVLSIFLIQGGILGMAGSLVGCGLGALLSIAFERLAGAGTGPQFPMALEPRLFLSASGLATAVGLIAAVIPAIRASRIDPATAIRNG